MEILLDLYMIKSNKGNKVMKNIKFVYTILFISIVLISMTTLCIAAMGAYEQEKDMELNYDVNKTSMIFSQFKCITLDNTIKPNDIKIEKNEAAPVSVVYTSEASETICTGDEEVVTETATTNVETVKETITETVNEETYYNGYTKYEIYELAKIIMCEAEGESQKCKEYIGQVIINRVNSNDFPNTIHNVIFDGYQFSPTFDGRWDYVEPNEACYEAAYKVINADEPLTNALYFEACRGDSWHSRNLTFITQLSNTKFYN